jgi:hypothetical protein
MKELLSALYKAQQQIKGAVKDSKNPYFNSMYADLESVLDAIRKPLIESDLCFTQSVSDGYLHTTIWHLSGENLVSLIPFAVPGTDMQKLGAALTYARRQGLCTVLGVPQVDDDGESAVGRNTVTTKAPPAPKVEVTNSKSTHVTKPSQANVSTVVTPKTDKISADLAKELGTPEVTPLHPLYVDGRDNDAVMAIATRLKISGDFLKKHKVEMKKALSENRTDTSLEAAIITFYEGKKS